MNIDFNKILTEREVLILKQISEGFSDHIIANQMGITVHTVRAFVHKIINKLQAKNRVNAACIAIREKIID